jgi:hypothetical protein
LNVTGMTSERNLSFKQPVGGLWIPTKGPMLGLPPRMQYRYEEPVPVSEEWVHVGEKKKKKSKEQKKEHDIEMKWGVIDHIYS